MLKKRDSVFPHKDLVCFQCTYLFIFPKLALATGILTFLYKGLGFFLGTSLDRGQDVKMCPESSDVQKPFVKVTKERDFCIKIEEQLQNSPTLSQWPLGDLVALAAS